MKNHLFILDDNNKPVPIEDVMEWCDWFTRDKRLVQQDWFGKILISTIFLGIDHASIIFAKEDDPPVLWETMIFGDPEEEYEPQWRYTSHEEALAHHKELVKKYELKYPRPNGEQAPKEK